MTTSATPLGPRPYDNFSTSDTEIPPFCFLADLEDEDKLLKWCKDAVNACERYYQPLFQTQIDDLLLLQGYHWLTADNMANKFFNRQESVGRRSPRIVLNHLYDFVEQWVSRLTRYKPVVAIYPTNSDQGAQDDAKICKDVLDHIWYYNRIDKTLMDFARLFKTTGEAFLFVEWDENKGDIHPTWLLQRQLGQRVPLLGPDGLPILSEQGEPMFIDKPVKIGDVRYRVVPGYHVFEQPVHRRDDIDWSIEWELQDIEYVKAKYPDKADQIRLGTSEGAFNDYTIDIAKMKNQIVVYTLRHRNSEFLQKGRYVKFTLDAILENKDYPYLHGEQPYIYLGDIDVPDSIRSLSFFRVLFPIQHQLNACASLIYKSLVLFAHPKIVMPNGTCEIQQLINEATIIGYDGGVPPTMMTHNPVSQDLFKYYDLLVETAEKLSGVFTMSRGNAPSGVRAAKALRVLEEQEDKRSYSTVTKYNNEAMVENAKKTIQVAGQFYRDDDGRLARIVDKDNEYRIKKFKVASLQRPVDIRIQNSTSLSQSPSARLEELVELAGVQIQPTSPISRSQFVNELDLGANEEFKDVVSRAYRCAKSENDDMIEGVPVADPTEDEDLVTHLKTHYQAVQSRSFKEGLPPERKQAFQRHVLITEYAAYKKAYGILAPTGEPLANPNLMFRAKLEIELPEFPVYFHTPTPGALMAPGAMPAGGGEGLAQTQMGNTLEGAPVSGGAAPVGTPPPELQPGPPNVG